MNELHADGGCELDNDQLKLLFGRNNIQHTMTQALTSEHNGIADRMSVTGMDMIIAMMHHAGAPHHFWCWATQAANLRRNSVALRVGTDDTPCQLWDREHHNPNVANM